jgi:hypothetical protein
MQGFFDSRQCFCSLPASQCRCINLNDLRLDGADESLLQESLNGLDGFQTPAESPLQAASQELQSVQEMLVDTASENGSCKPLQVALPAGGLDSPVDLIRTIEETLQEIQNQMATAVPVPLPVLGRGDRFFVAFSAFRAFSLEIEYGKRLKYRTNHVFMHRDGTFRIRDGVTTFHYFVNYDVLASWGVEAYQWVLQVSVVHAFTGDVIATPVCHPWMPFQVDFPEPDGDRDDVCLRVDAFVGNHHVDWMWVPFRVEKSREMQRFSKAMNQGTY